MTKSQRIPRASAPQVTAPTPEEAAQDEALLAQGERLAEETAAERSRGTGAKDRAQPRATRTEYLDEDGKPIRRRVNREGNPFDLPEKDKKSGWDYAWWPVRIQGEQVDPSFIVEVREGGWRPVDPKDMPNYMPPGWEKKFIERGGQILYTRPMHLTEESRAEDVKIAENQRYDKLKGALAGPAELQKVAPRQVMENELYGSVGTARKT